MNNVKDLRVVIGETLADLRAKKLTHHEARVVAKLGNAMIASAALQLKHQELLGTKDPMPFLIEK